MVLQFVNLGKSSQPLLNEFHHGRFFESRTRTVTRTLFEQVRRDPNLLAMLSRVITEHFLRPVDFFDLDGNPLKGDKLKEITKMWVKNRVQEGAIAGQAMDFFVDGSGFGWHASVFNNMNEKQKEVMTAEATKMKQVGIGIGEFAMERAKMPRKINYLAASTITIKHDEHDVVFYIQEVAQKRLRWEVDQVVHVKNMEFNGEVRGYTPLRALTTDIAIMFMLKENIIAKLQNGGSPDQIIALKNASGISKGKFLRLETALESFSHLRKSHGNMPVDAEITVHKMGTDLKDMEYRELAMFVISQYALSLGLPTSRIPFMMTGKGGTTGKGQLSGNTEDSYQDLINARRMVFENAWNPVFMDAGFTFKFRRDNLQDDIRETQASANRAAAMMSYQKSLAMVGVKFDLDAHLAFLSGKRMNFTRDDIEPLADTDSRGDNINMGEILNSMQTEKSDTKGRTTQDISDAKKQTATNEGVSA